MFEQVNFIILSWSFQVGQTLRMCLSITFLSIRIFTPGIKYENHMIRSIVNLRGHFFCKKSYFHVDFYDLYPRKWPCGLISHTYGKVYKAGLAPAPAGWFTGFTGRLKPVEIQKLWKSPVHRPGTGRFFNRYKITNYEISTNFTGFSPVRNHELGNFNKYHRFFTGLKSEYCEI